MTSTDRVWMVTGASKGIGLHTVQAALAHGDRVVATSRNPEKLAETVDAGEDRFLAVDMAIGDEDSVAAAVAKGRDTFGSIDVLVNNAGYSLLGAVEEISDAEARANFDVNVFGLLNVTRAVLPVMREQRSGRIINLASISANVTGPATGLYSGTKAAVLMLSEALADEVEQLGLHVTAICPGGVRTDFLDSSSSRHPAKEIADYEAVRAMQAAYGRLNHQQSGNPALVGEAFVALAGLENPPRRLYLGGDSLHAIEQKARQVIEDLEPTRRISLSING